MSVGKQSLNINMDALSRCTLSNRYHNAVLFSLRFPDPSKKKRRLQEESSDGQKEESVKRLKSD